MRAEQGAYRGGPHEGRDAGEIENAGFSRGGVGGRNGCAG